MSSIEPAVPEAPASTGASSLRRSMSLPLRINLISLVFAALVATVLTALGGFFLYQQQADNAEAHARLAAEELAQRAGRLIELGLALDDFIGFDEQCDAVIRNDPLLEAAALLGTDHRPRARNRTAQSSWPAVGQDMASPTRGVARPRDGAVVMQPVPAGKTEVEGYAAVKVNTEAVVAATLSRVAWLVVSALLLFVVGLVIQQGVFWRTVGRPLEGLVRTADSIRPDALPDAVPPPMPGIHDEDDIGRLHAAFARLLQRVAEARKELLAQNENLEAIVRDRTLQLELANAELAHDIQRRQQLEDDLRRVANTDALTGLANRAFVLPHAERKMQQARRQRTWMGVALFDFDGFKKINDVHGHAAGDAVLRTMATRLAAVCRGADVLARLGGDEFLLVFDGITHESQTVPMARRLVAQFERPVPYEGLSLPVGVSLGIALYPIHAPTLEDLLAAADRAMYDIKRRGGGFLLASEPEAAQVAAQVTAQVTPQVTPQERRLTAVEGA